MRPRLVTIPLSHYCERARWALDLAQVDYDEEQHLQVFAMKKVRALGGRKTVPVLVANGQTLFDSTDILRWADARTREPLYPQGERGDDVTALDKTLADRYGVETRRLAYAYFFRNVHACLPYNAGAAPGWQVAFLRALRPFVQPRLEAYVGLTPDDLERGLDFVNRTLDDIDTRLADGRPHLCGDRLTAADITFAAMTAVIVLPPQYPVPLPPPQVLDAEARQMVEAMRERPAGRYAMTMYAQRPSVRARLPRPIRTIRSRSV